MKKFVIPPTTIDWAKYTRDNPDLFKQTEAERERKEATEEQEKVLSTVQLPAVQSYQSLTDAPSKIKTPNPYDSWSTSIDQESTNYVNKYDDDPIGRATYNRLTNKNNLDIERKKSFDRYDNQEKFSLNDLDEDSTYQEVATRFLRSIGSDENIYENLRDAKYSIGDAVMLASRSGKWTKQQQSDYKYLKTIFDKADTGGAKHILQATKDIAIDVVFDLPNLLAVPFIVSTGGAGGIALSAAARFGATQAFRQGAKKASQEFAKNKTLRTASIGMTEGAYDAGIINMSNQVSDVQTGIRQGYSPLEAGVAVTAGAVLGGGLSTGAVKLGNAMHRRNINKYAEESGLPREQIEKAKPTKEELKNWRQGVRVYNNLVDAALKPTAFITGKATTPYQRLAEKSGTLESLLKNVRYDAMRRITDKGLDEVARASFGGSVTTRQNQYILLMQKAMSNLSGRFKKLNPKDNEDLLYLLSNRVDIDNHVKLIRVNKQGRDEYEIIASPKIDGKEFSPEVLKAAKGISDAFNKIWSDGLEIERVGGEKAGQVIKLFKNSQQKIANYFPRHWIIQAIQDKPEVLEDILVRSRYTDMRTEKTTRAKMVEEGLEDGVDIPDESLVLVGRNDKPIDIKTIDQHSFGEVINPATGKPFFERYNGFEDMALESLKKKYNLENIKSIEDLIQKKPELKAEFDLTARKFKAKVIVQQILNRADPKIRDLGVTKAGLGGNAFTRERAFADLDDLELQRLGLVETDVMEVVQNYAVSMSKTIERARFFGRSESDFEENFMQPIFRELEEAGEKLGAKEKEKLRKGLLKLYQVTTGLENSLPQSKALKNLTDVVKVTQQLAHLPFATLSSLSEPFIALSRADIADTNSFVTEFAKAGGRVARKNFRQLSDTMKNITGKDTRLFRELDDETFYDVYQAGVATENAMMDRIEGMYGEGLNSGIAKNISNTFFNLNLLQPWTQAVQMGAFKFGQQKVIRILGELSDNTNFYGSILSDSGRLRRKNELHQLGIDSEEGITAYRKHLDANGNFNEVRFRQDQFFDTQVTPATALFSREIILNPSAAEGNKPLWFNTWWAQVLVQFAGYPTAFNNTVLKGMARNAISDPAANAPKVLAATTMMTGIATLTNAIRSEGRSITEAEDDVEIVADSIRRWGGFGPFDYVHRYIEGSKMNSGGVTALLKAPTGPVVSDALDMILYRQGIPEVVVQNLPGYSAYPKELRKGLRDWSKGLFKEESFEEYRGFATGGKVTPQSEIDEVYSFLTRDEDEYVSDDSKLISLYKEKDLPSLDIKDTFYIDLKDFTVSSKLDAYRKSDVIGVPVYKGKGRGNVAGKIKFNKLLKLDIDNADIDSVQESITKNKDDIIYTDDFIANEIIKETNYQLTLRDDVLKDDPNVTPAKENLIKKSKSFLVRNEILKLGYDALKTKEGYTLLRENQFLPTEIIDRRQQVFLGGLLKRIGGFLGVLRRRAIGTYNRTQTKIEDIQKQAALIGGPGQAVSRSLITKEKEVLPELFKDKLIQSESSGNYKATKVAPNNQNLYVGAYQFGDARLKDYRRATKEQFTMDEFKESRELQDKVFDWHINDIRKGIKKNKLDQYIGQRIKNIPITEPGMVAAAHLGGFTGMKRFITLSGEPYYDKDYWEKYQKLKPSDADDGVTYLSDYLDKFKDTRFEREQYGLGGRLASKVASKLTKGAKETTEQTLLKTDVTDNWSKLGITLQDEIDFKKNTKGKGAYKRSLKLQEAAVDLSDDTIPLETRKETFKNVLEEVAPVSKRIYTKEKVKKLKVLTPKEISLAAGRKSENIPVLGSIPGTSLKPKEKILIRLDVPAFERSGDFIDTVHEIGEKTFLGKVKGYVPTVYLDNVSVHNVNRPQTYGIMMGRNKFPMSIIQGEHIPHNPQELKNTIIKLLDDPEWEQIGFNPSYSTEFFNRKTLNPLLDLDKLIGIGGFFLAKNPKYGKWLDSLFTFDKDVSVPITTSNSILNKLKERFEFKQGEKTTKITIPKGTQVPFNKGGKVRGSLTFNQQYHLETIKQKRAMRNAKGQTVTVRAEGFEKDGIVYNLPTYDRRGGTITNPLEFFKEDIKTGRIKGYALDKETYSQDKNNMHLHPANRAASKEHKMMEKEVPEEVIMYEEK